MRSFKRIKASELRPGVFVEVQKGEEWVWAEVETVEVLHSDTEYLDSVLIGLVGYTNVEYLATEVVLTCDEKPAGVPNRVEVPDWDEYFLDIAKAVAARAKCRRRQVGSVLVDQRHRIISTGYNGFPSGEGVLDCMDGVCPRGLTVKGEVPPDSSYTNAGSPGYCKSIHSEANAVIFSGKDTRGATIYITDSPCPECQRLLAGAGVIRAVWPEGEVNPIDGYKN